jgi:hypothetical protein
MGGRSADACLAARKDVEGGGGRGGAPGGRVLDREGGTTGQPAHVGRVCMRAFVAGVTSVTGGAFWTAWAPLSSSTTSSSMPGGWAQGALDSPRCGKVYANAALTPMPCVRGPWVVQGGAPHRAAPSARERD